MADEEDKNKEENAEQPSEGSNAFDNLAAGTDPSRPPEQPQEPTADQQSDDVVGGDDTPRSTEQQQTEDVIQQGPPPVEEETGNSSGFAQNFEENYESDFESFDDAEVYEDDFEDDFIEEEFPEAEPADFDDAIDAEFTDFDEGEEGFGDGSDDDWSVDGEDGSAGTPKAKSGVKVDGLLSNKNILYAAIGGVALLVAVGAYMTMSSGGGSTNAIQARQASGAPQAQSTASSQSQSTAPSASQGQKGQSLSSILESGNIEDDSQSGSALLDNLDSLDDIGGGAPAEEPVAVATKPASELPVFQERQTLSSLPMPSPMENPDGTVESNVTAMDELQQVEQAFDGPVETFEAEEQVVQPMNATLPNERAANEQGQNIAQGNQGNDGILANPFDSIDAMPARDTQATKQALENISKEAEARDADSRGRVKQVELRNNIEKFEEQTSTFVQRVEQIEQKISNLPDMQRIEQMMAQYSEMSAKVERLERELRDTKSALRTAKSSSSSSSTSPAPVKTATRKAVKPVAKKIQWELRAASPGQAWVSQKGKSDLKQVSIGDQLADLGTIRAISMQNGRWVLEASRGTIYQ
jgi:outer membrane murein-binding lipoprotein Lpp